MQHIERGRGKRAFKGIYSQIILLLIIINSNKINAMIRIIKIEVKEFNVYLNYPNFFLILFKTIAIVVRVVFKIKFY